MNRITVSNPTLKKHLESKLHIGSRTLSNKDTGTKISHCSNKHRTTISSNPTDSLIDSIVTAGIFSKGKSPTELFIKSLEHLVKQKSTELNTSPKALVEQLLAKVK